MIAYEKRAVVEVSYREIAQALGLPADWLITSICSSERDQGRRIIGIFVSGDSVPVRVPDKSISPILSLDEIKES